MTRLHLQIVGQNLPGRQFERYQAVHVGIQRRSDVIDVVPGDAAKAGPVYASIRPQRISWRVGVGAEA